MATGAPSKLTTCQGENKNLHLVAKCIRQCPITQEFHVAAVVWQNGALARPSSLLSTVTYVRYQNNDLGRGPCELASLSQPSEREERARLDMIDRSKKMERTI